MRTAELKLGRVSEGFVVTKGHFNEYFAKKGTPSIDMDA